MPESEAKRDWMKANSVMVGMRLMNAGDADIIEYLKAVDNKQGFIKAAIRYYIKNNEGENKK